MPLFNDVDMSAWKSSEVWTDSLWLINERDKSGKHDGFYHGNFVPQIPRQLILRYTKKDDIVLDPFVGSGTSAYEAEMLGRNFIGIDIQEELLTRIQSKIDTQDNFIELLKGDSADEETFGKVKSILAAKKKSKVQLVILHPPYADIIKFSENPNDLSNCASINSFLENFVKVVENTISILEDNRYLALVIGDKYAQKQWIPLGFYCMYAIQKLGLTLKSVVVKNMEGNRAKQNQQAIWKYRALSSDYYIFKHEYIFLFKKTK
jgi:DNA modification methylase